MQERKEAIPRVSSRLHFRLTFFACVLGILSCSVSTSPVLHTLAVQLRVPYSAVAPHSLTSALYSKFPLLLQSPQRTSRPCLLSGLESRASGNPGFPASPPYWCFQIDKEKSRQTDFGNKSQAEPYEMYPLLDFFFFTQNCLFYMAQLMYARTV